MRLQNKRVIITGGSTGIGAAVARRFLAEGAKVAVWCRNPDNAKAIAAELPDLTVVAAVDVADAEVRQCVAHGVLHRGCRSDGSRLADALGAERVARRRCLVFV